MMTRVQLEALMRGESAGALIPVPTLHTESLERVEPMRIPGGRAHRANLFARLLTWALRSRAGPRWATG